MNWDKIHIDFCKDGQEKIFKWRNDLHLEYISVQQNVQLLKAWKWTEDMQSSALVAHPPYGSTSWSISDAILLTMIAKSSYLNYHDLPVCSNQTEPISPDLSHQQRFPPQNCHSLDLFFFACLLVCLFFTLFCENSRAW